ncbi:MAG: CvpA family protein [Alicyclobacillus sp.]|nr:CvpA family protein [Alicyclobacillus sp.]
MDTLDWVIVAIVVLGGWNGYRIGLFRQVTRLFGAVLAYGLAIWLRPYLMPVISHLLQGAHLQPPRDSVLSLFLGNVSGAISFTVLFLVAFVLLRYCAGLVDALFSLPILSTLNRLAGLAAGLILALLLVYVASLVARYVSNPWLQHELAQSSIVQWLDATRTHVHGTPPQS